MFSFLRFVFVGLMGVFGGLFFAQKSGKRFRNEMKSSRHPFQTALKELKSISGDIKEWAQSSEEMQKLFEQSKEVMNDLVNRAKKLGEEASEEASQELEELSEEAKKAAKDLKKKAEETKHKFENKLEKEVKDASKKTKK